MKNLIVYYVVILAPPAAIIYLLKIGDDRPILILSLILLYALIYRPITDALKLIALGILKKDEWWKMFIPFYGHRKWFYELYFKIN